MGIEAAVRLLLERQNLAGSWGAVAGRPGNTETTVWVLTALASTGSPDTADSIRRGLEWLSQHQNSDGSFRLNDRSIVGSWTTGPALLCLSAFSQYKAQALAAARWSLNQEGASPGWLSSLLVRLTRQEEVNKINMNLTGWSWTPGTFSWVEPTSYFLIALKRMKSRLQETNVSQRIREAELMIYDRVCDAGGWNYGNSKIYGEALWPYPDVTAIALLALQDHRDAEPVRRSLAALEKMIANFDSGFALSWATLCFSIYSRDVSQWRELLVKQFEKTQFLGETKSLALAVLALTGGARFFRV